MGPDAVTGDAQVPGLIALRDPERLRSGMGDVSSDPGILHLLVDSKESKGEIFQVDNKAPGSGGKRPRIDELIIFSEGLAVGLARQRWG